MVTIQEAKEFLRANWNEGIDCPCCGRLVKLYKRKLNVGMCLFLISLYKLTVASGKDFHPADEILEKIGHTKSLDYSVLKWWDLIRPNPNMEFGEDAKKDSGYWMLTGRGLKFVEGTAIVPTRVYIYNDKKMGEDEEGTDIRQALGNKFNYLELMYS